MEVLSGGEWWDAEVTKIKGGQARVHYVGGADDEDEWIPIGRLDSGSKVHNLCLDKRPKVSVATEPVS